jgi:hypothetical protein
MCTKVNILRMREYPLLFVESDVWTPPSIEVTWYRPKKGAHTMKSSNVIGIDLAKNVIQIYTIS